MADIITPENYEDRRRHMRRSVYRTAELMLRGAPSGIGCTVVDESSGGVQVETPQPLDLPDEVMIKFGDMATQLVRRCWSRGNRAGYQFIEIVPAERQLLNDQRPPAQEASFVAFNDCIHISRPLLDLPGEPAEWLYPAEQIHALLASPRQLPRVAELNLLLLGEQDEVLKVLAPHWR